MSAQLTAFLDMIAVSEGTAKIGDRGYNCIVGSTTAQPILFGSYSDHPRLKVQLRPDLVSSAAGRYQILARFFDAYRARLALPDFGPDSQDAIAIQMLRERDALVDIEAGRFDAAIQKASNIWASFPGNNYGQRQNQLGALRLAFTDAGGVVV